MEQKRRIVAAGLGAAAAGSFVGAAVLPAWSLAALGVAIIVSGTALVVATAAFSGTQSRYAKLLPAALAGGALVTLAAAAGDIASGRWPAALLALLSLLLLFAGRAMLNQTRTAICMPSAATMGMLRAIKEIEVLDGSVISGSLPLVRTKDDTVILLGEVTGDSWPRSREFIDFTTQLAKMRRVSPDVTGVIVVRDGIVGVGGKVNGEPHIRSCAPTRLRHTLLG